MLARKLVFAAVVCVGAQIAHVIQLMPSGSLQFII